MKYYVYVCMYTMWAMGLYRDLSNCLKSSLKDRYVVVLIMRNLTHQFDCLSSKSKDLEM